MSVPDGEATGLVDLSASPVRGPLQGLEVCRADYADARHAEAIVVLLDAYARDPMGGGESLSDFARQRLVPELARRAHAFSVLAFWQPVAAASPEPVGLVNCLEGFSTFACQPLVNVHDVVVLPQARGLGVGQRMLAAVEAIARERGACKLTLEVLEGNAAACRLYVRQGFERYQLDPRFGHAQFMQKWL